MEVTTYTIGQFQLFILILMRVSGMVFSAPFFGGSNTPQRVKVGLSIFFSFLMMPLVSSMGNYLPQTLGAYLMMVFMEFSVGFIIGFTASLVFTAVQLAGQLVGQQMGITIANVLDPVSNIQVSIISQFQFMFGMLIFVLVGGVEILAGILHESFIAVPLLGFEYSDRIVNFVVFEHFSRVLLLSIQLQAPLLAVLFVATIAMGFMARTVPEMNIFIIGFALRIAIGLIMLWLSVSGFAALLQIEFLNIRELFFPLPKLGL